MSDPVLSQLIAAFFAALPATIMALAALVSSLMNGRKLSQVKTQTDGMSERLEKAAFREGAQSEKDNPTLAAPAAGNPRSIQGEAKTNQP